MHSSAVPPLYVLRGIPLDPAKGGGAVMAYLDTMLLFQLAPDVDRFEKEEVREETEPA